MSKIIDNDTLFFMPEEDARVRYSWMLDGYDIFVPKCSVAFIHFDLEQNAFDSTMRMIDNAIERVINHRNTIIGWLTGTSFNRKKRLRQLYEAREEFINQHKHLL